MKGSFADGVGIFDWGRGHSGYILPRSAPSGSYETPLKAHWEQAFSTDGGETWDTNWVMEFERVRE